MYVSVRGNIIFSYGCTISYQFHDFSCNQWRKFNEFDDIYVSMLVCAPDKRDMTGSSCSKPGAWCYLRFPASPPHTLDLWRTCLTWGDIKLGIKTHTHTPLPCPSTWPTQHRRELQDPIYWHAITSIPPGIGNPMPSKVWDEISRVAPLKFENG